MKRKWEMPEIHTSFTSIPTEEYNLLLDEWAEMVYRHFCQLPRDQTKVPVNQMSQRTERSGTNG